MFNSIHRGKMQRILTAYRISDEHVINTIANMYENTQAHVLSPDGETDGFEIIAEVFRGNTLALYLFTIMSLTMQ